MRLLHYNNDGEYSLTQFFEDIPQYAILSHTWGPEEVTFKDIKKGNGTTKAGLDKIRFCGEQARHDGLEYFWVDTCCIDKSSSTELAEAINSMFQWYRDAAKCYVFLSDVPRTDVDITDQSYQQPLESAFRTSRWFTRGWTLQELLAPKSVEFFSQKGERIGDKRTLEQQVHEITGIAVPALRGVPLLQFDIEDRLSWAEDRQATREEDKAYSLFGVFDIQIPLLYGEGGKKAMKRLREEIDKPLRDKAFKRLCKEGDISLKELDRLPSAAGAAFNSFDRQQDPTCLPDTRVGLLQEICDWTDGQDEQCVFWLNGLAGTGKSTIANEIATSHTLCSQCINIINESSETLQAWISEVELFGEMEAGWRRENLEGDERPKWRSNRSTPHTMKSLQESARAGCHLCTLFDVESINNDTAESQPSQLEYSFSFDPLDSGIALTDHKSKGFFSFLTFSVRKYAEWPSKELLRCISSKVLLPDNFAYLVRHWLNICTTTHKKCPCIPHLKAKTPTRLLDISNRELFSLVVSESVECIASIEYVTLSHRWTSSGFFKLTLDNVELLKAGISYSYLTQTFQDAMILTKALGYKYIWIDALCIIQDSPEDWAQESNRMADVYRYGILNICIYTSTLYPGCLPARNPLSWSPCLLAKSNGSLLVAGADLNPMLELIDTEILNRGWVFQERILSPRTVYVGDRDCVFECVEAITSERAPLLWRQQGLSYPASKGLFGRMIETATQDIKLNALPEAKEKHNAVGDLFHFWNTIVDTYSTGSLSFPSDRLPALAAIATTLRDAIGIEYIAGHWIEFLPISLLWRQEDICPGTKILPSGHRFPSWSWASVDGSVAQHHLRFSDLDEVSAKLLGSHVTEINGRTAVLGEVETACLHVAGVVHCLRDWNLVNDNEEQVAEIQFADCVVKASKKGNTVHLEEAVKNETPLLFLTITRGDIGEAGLILAPYKDGFQRVGLMDVYFEDEQTGRRDPFWGKGLEQKVLLY